MRVGSRSVRRGFTLVEIMVVILIIGMMAAAGAMVITPQISYFRSRKDAESLLGALRHARAAAMSSGRDAGTYGVVLYRGALTTDRLGTVAHDAANNSPFCFAEFGDRDTDRSNNDRNQSEVSKPVGTNLATAVTENEPESSTNGVGRVSLRNSVMNMHEETSLRGAGGASMPDSTMFQFDRQGKLDMRAGASAVSGLIAEPAVSPKAYSFELRNPNMGYYRIRVRLNGTIEISALCDLSDANPYSLDNAGNQIPF
jgi:prepilin-type N-terminal cleavage/methylation domain-containing protein